MFVIYILSGLFLLYLFCVFPFNNVQENLTAAECKQVREDQFRMANKASYSSKNLNWCQYDGDCVPVKSSYCGTNTLTSGVKTCFPTKKICEKDLQPYLDMSPSECLDGSFMPGNSNRGWCTDSYGSGLCLRGDDESPFYRFKYNYCLPSRVGCLNSWKIAHNDQLIFNSS